MPKLSAHDRTAPTPPTVARQLVHKHHAAEVLLTGWRRLGQDRFVVSARWPGNHGFYAVRHSRHDPLLLSETVRQSFPLLAHEAYDVPFGHHLVWETYAWRLDPLALRADGSDAEVELRVRAREVGRRRGGVALLSLAYDVVREGIPLAAASSRFTIQAPAVYRRLRGARADQAAIRPIPAPPAVPAASVGREDPCDVVLAPADTGERWQLRVDTGHRVLFDHPVDHVPGMLLLEAARQAARAARGRPAGCVTAMDTRFHRYAELDAPTWIEARRTGADAAGRTRLAVTGRQGDHTVYSCAVTLDETKPGPR
ncbi:ScbA/BarX family gamma-butyrolactone biosynthesis protein [Streptomyces sp. NPDC014748]|uniref:ScbA/BarX family gamma-butyrolactone biosynthesis protein n=1 Tax=Streptomyces sp. NPDC014748 TaxID=3364905 RepID=UPI0037015CE6